MSLNINLLNQAQGSLKQQPVHAIEQTAEKSWWRFLNQEIHISHQGLSLKHKEAFYLKLEALLHAGLDIQQALVMIKSALGKKAQQQIIENLETHLISGASLSEAIQKEKAFSDYEVFSIQIGEETGNILTVLKQLADFYTRALSYRRQLIGALAYPVFVSSFALLAVYFLLNNLVPVFSDIYDRFGGDLPPITQWVLAFSEGIQAYGVWIILSLCVAFFLLYQFRNRSWLRRFKAWIMRRIPVFGPIIHRIYLGRFCQSMALLLQSRVSLLVAVNLVQKMIRFWPIEQALNQSKLLLEQGASLEEGLKTHSIFPKELIALIRVGEESSSLDNMFHRLADQYHK
ncbi:MAG: type II secretion system F family protein, partial [Bacteroidota bacterium]